MTNPLRAAAHVFLPGRVTPVTRRPHLFVIRASHYDAAGALLWRDDEQDNLLHDEGEQLLLSRLFNTGLTGYTTTPAALYLGVDNRAALAEADTLASLVDEGGLTAGRTSGGGYSRKAVNTDGVTAPFWSVPGQITPSGLTAGYYATASADQSYTASDDWSAVKNIFIATHATATATAAGQRLIASVAMSQSRDLASGDTLTINCKVVLSEV